MEIEYLETPPAAALRPWVDRYWSFRTKGPSSAFTPDQCCIPLGMPEFMIHLYGKHSEGLYKGRWTTFPKAYFTGISTTPMVWRMQGTACMVGARIKPEGALHLLGLPIASFRDAYTDAHDHLDTDAAEELQRYMDQPEPEGMIRGMEQLLMHRLDRCAPMLDRFVEALCRIREQGVRWDKEALYECLFVGDRQMQRMFKERLGMSPRAYFKLMRFREAYDTAREHRQVDWMELVSLLGYSDQPHLIRDFKRFAGSSPQVFLRQPVPRFQRPALRP